MRSPRTFAVIGLLLVLVAGGCAVEPAITSESPSHEPSSTPPAQRPAAQRPGIGRPERLSPSGLARPAQPAMPVSYRAALVDDHCTDRDLAAPAASDIALTVLDRSYGLPATYAPDDLEPAAEAGLTDASGTKLVRAVLLDDLAAMRAAWESAGLTIVIDSAYRSYAAQAATYDNWVIQIGPEGAAARTARPGHSEHQLGTAIDVSSPGWSGRFGDWATESAEGAWMAERAWEYGFVMSYPAGGEAESCYGYEPWHYRWIGREAAAEHRDSGLVLRDFLARRADG
ncbi:MAG TPA: M15 family metallopeptidase [Candidatus Angelobacter sp.]|nr:M15 family metallopeptidase [Candidatus Angelobacter sp.]